MTTATARIGISESQAIANSRAESRYRQRTDQERRVNERTVDDQRQANWRSKRERNEQTPPRQLEALLLWFQREIQLDLPDALHTSSIWFDTVTNTERTTGLTPVGGSLIGSLAYNPAFGARLEGSPHSKNTDGDLLSPFRSAFARLRVERRHIADLLEVVARHDFDWRAIAGRPFYGRSSVDPSARVLVMALPEDVLRVVLESGLTRLWELTRRREAHIGIED